MANMASACALVVSEEKSFDPVRSWTTKTAATTCAFVSVSVISICIMVVCGVFIVREYALSKSYKRNHCWVEDISYLDVKDCNFCPGHKTKEKNSASCIQSKFPCVQVTVAYEIDGAKREGLLHSSSIEASGLYSQCSHQVCLKDFEASKKAIEHYLEKWKNLMVRHLSHHHNGVDSTESKNIFVHSILRYIFDLKSANNNRTDLESEPGLNSSKLQLAKLKNKVKNTTHRYDINDGYFQCFVNELNPHDVIEHKSYTKSDVIHCMLWPALVVLLCCCAFLYIEASRRSLTFCGRRERPSDHVNFPEGRGFLPSGKVKVLNRSHFTSRGLEEHLKSDRYKESEAYIKKANKTYPVKSRLQEERGKTDISDEDKISHLCSSGRSSRPEVKVQTS